MDKKPYLLAIDAGTGSVRAVVFDFKGKEIAAANAEWFHKEDPRYKGSMDFDCSANWKLTCKCILQVLETVPANSIAAVSTTCMREGLVLYDENGQEIWACANVDARSTKEVAELIKADAGMEKRFYEKSGQSFALDAIPRLRWVKDNEPEIYKKLHRIGMFNDWLIYKMTEKLAVEPSNGSTTGLVNLKTRDWDYDIIEECGLPKSFFPPILESGIKSGTVTKKGAEDTGLQEGTPVITGGGDAQLGCVGIGLIRPHQAAVFGGSFWQYEYNTDSVVIPPDCSIRINCHAVPGITQYEALAFKPGLILRWYRDAFCEKEKQEAEEQNCSIYAILDKKAESIPAGSYGMLNSFSDVMNFMSWKHAAPTFSNFDFDAEKYNRYTFYRSILENTAFVTKGHIDLLYDTTGHKPEKIFFAGGAARSKLWCQILADTINMPVIVPREKEATALGAAILAAYGIGHFKTIEEAVANMTNIEAEYKPNKENHNTYSRLYLLWREFYKKQLELCDNKITQYMWIAPGL